jgi:putative hydrolase of the HAD superfamily
MIAAVLFDLYETLLTERGTAPVRASSLGKILGLDQAAFRKAWKRERSRGIRGELSFAATLSEAAAQQGHTVDPLVLRRLCEDRIREKSALFERFGPDGLAVIRHLRSQGIKLAVVSNCFAEDVQAWSTCVVAQWFDASIFSFAVRCAKPESAIYQQAINRLCVDPAETLFVGDGGDDELLGAERAGLRAAQAAWYREELNDTPASIPRLKAWSDVLDLVAAG